MCSVGGKLLKAVQSFYVDRACARVRMNVRKQFPVNIELRQCCVMSQSFFDCIYELCDMKGES